MLLKTARPFQEAPEATCEVRAEHVQHIDALLDLLHALNDPYVGGQRLQDLVQRIDVLVARCLHAARLKRPKAQVQSLQQALLVLGNRGLETVLFHLLEDLTIISAEVEASST